MSTFENPNQKTNKVLDLHHKIDSSFSLTTSTVIVI